MGIDVERHDELLAYLDGKLSQTLSSEHVEHHLLRIGIVRLYDKRTCLPFATGRNTAALGKHCNNLTL